MIPPATAAARPPVPASGFDTLDPALQGLLHQVCNTQRPHGTKFYLLEVSEEDNIAVREYTTIEELTVRIRALLGKPYHLVPFMGQRLQISAGPHRYLRTPYGALPLFDLPPADTVDVTVDGWVGPEEQPLTIPTTPADITDVEEDDEDEDTSAPPVTGSSSAVVFPLTPNDD